jgi:hypothetical protein
MESFSLLAADMTQLGLIFLPVFIVAIISAGSIKRPVPTAVGGRSPLWTKTRGRCGGMRTVTGEQSGQMSVTSTRRMCTLIPFSFACRIMSPVQRLRPFQTAMRASAYYAI